MFHFYSWKMKGVENRAFVKYSTRQIRTKLDCQPYFILLDTCNHMNFTLMKHGAFYLGLRWSVLACVQPQNQILTGGYTDCQLGKH
jgi:hypothetical protein